MRRATLCLLAAVVASVGEGFSLSAPTTSTFRVRSHDERRSVPMLSPAATSLLQHRTRRSFNMEPLYAANNQNEKQGSRWRRGWKKMVQSPKRILLAAAIVLSTLGGNNIQVAKASAPVMALPKAEGRDPATEAMIVHEKKQLKLAQQELADFAAQARAIEAQQGQAARKQFETEYKQQKIKESEEKAAGLVQLKRDLLDQGICPFTDLEGQRQVTLYDKGIDLGKISGTPYYLEKVYEKKQSKKAMNIQKAPHRQIVACMVSDMKNRGVDPLEYFEKHQEQTESILEMQYANAVKIVQQYQANLEQFGQITVPAPGELSVKEKQEQLAKDPKFRKQQIQEEKKRQKEIQRAEAARIKAEKKAEQLRKKEAAKAEKEAAKAAKAAAAAGVVMQSDIAASDNTDDDTVSVDEPHEEEFHNALMEAPRSKLITSPKIAATTVVLGGGAYAFKLYQDRAAVSEAERQRQLKLLMGELGSDNDDDEEDNDDSDDRNLLESKDTTTAIVPPAESEAAPTPKRRTLGLKSVFGKKKNERETDIFNLVHSDAQAPEFCTTLAKILTYGAPGRFPAIVALPGGMPMEKFNVDEAQTILTQAQADSGLTLEESAEIFANVVNCMLIGIVDLASAGLKEKDDSVTVNAINIVVDFMNHAASLFKSVATDVTIKPVTYGGDLSKSKLEQMYAVYASSAMLDFENIADDFDDRVALLRDVFQISEKKAEGLMAKAMQKNMMSMLKDPAKAEEMMKSLGGMEGMGDMLGGMPGMAGMGQDGEMNPEQLKEMLVGLKALKDSGQIPEDEFEEVKKQFNESFGSSIEDVMKEASSNEGELSGTDKELLELMKSIMDD